AAALCSAASAPASLRPIRRSFGETTVPQLRAGVVPMPAFRANGRVTVIARLKLPPLAAAFAGRRLSVSRGSNALDASSASSRAYLARVDAAQRAALAQLHSAIPEARAGRRFRIVLDGITVTLPARRLARLARLSSVSRLYSTTRFTMELNRSGSVIGADELRATSGARGDGIKIGVVDDGVDAANPFFNPSGYSYPAGFPRGNTQYTTPKVIVARTFPGPGSGTAGNLPVDRAASFHGTHVAGIAAGNEGTTAPPGPDHPLVTGLSGVAPRAYIGNYRVFTVPTPIGHVANTPEIVAAFESAVADGMNVINFSGGGPEGEPSTDPMIETIRNVAAAGVVPVIAAGNDRDQYGLGSVGSPGSAPASIAVAAVSNTHVFSPALSVVTPGAPDYLRQIPVAQGAVEVPLAWVADQQLVDVASIVSGGLPVDRQLCGPPGFPNDASRSPLPPGSLAGAIALANRGGCAFVEKADRAKAAGATGLILIDNRPGEANGIPIPLSIPAAMISDLDGARLRAYLATTGGRAVIRVPRDILAIETGRSGIVTSFSSAGPSDFAKDMKPDLSAPGGQILSSTLPEFARSPFAVFDGTSMATPHVAGAAALLRQRHAGWTVQQIKSALVQTAGPAWADTARTVEAPVLLEGGGLVNLPRADNPLVFADPSSLAFHGINVNHGPQSATLLVRLTDAGGGSGSWSVALSPQAATAGASIAAPPTILVQPGVETSASFTVNAAPDAQPGLDYGFVVLRHGSDTRRIPYQFRVERPALENAPATPLKTLQIGSTAVGPNRVSEYCCPSAPFGPAVDYVGPPQREDGAEQLYVTTVTAPVANVGVAVIATAAGAIADPFFLASPNENDVTGYAGIPTNVNPLTFDFPLDIGAAGDQLPPPKNYYVSVDSPRDPFTGQLMPGRYLLRSWANDVQPPTIKLLTKRIARGRHTLVARVTDNGSGVDPLSLAISYRNVLLGASDYDPVSGLALFGMPIQAPKLQGPVQAATMIAYDYQETKNINVTGPGIMPNTAFLPVKINAVTGPAVTWVVPDTNACVPKTARLAVVASSTTKISAVQFFDGARKIAVKRKGVLDLYFVDWKNGKAKKGKHVLRAVVVAAGGKRASATRSVRVCR
ncbi:MAG: minor extracellular serine protease Vpr, partial [Gaiellaceae bacterium]|nr:minor extracellular serine protease Vpr [Gaiellaceae bacterium]